MNESMGRCMGICDKVVRQRNKKQNKKWREASNARIYVYVAIDRFCTAPDVFVFLLSTKAGGTRNKEKNHVSQSH